MRDSGLPADVLLGKLKKDISFALPRGTIAQVTGYTCPRRLRLPSVRSSAEDEELALHEAGWDARQPPLLPSFTLRRRFDLLLAIMLIKLAFPRAILPSWPLGCRAYSSPCEPASRVANQHPLASHFSQGASGTIQYRPHWTCVPSMLASAPPRMSSPSTWRVGIVESNLLPMLISFLPPPLWTCE
jgi:hypothetical protein